MAKKRREGTETAKVRRHRHEVEANAGVAGALGGVTVGSVAGLPGAIVGAVIGGVVGAMAGAVAEKSAAARAAEDRALDDETSELQAGAVQPLPQAAECSPAKRKAPNRRGGPCV